MKKIRGGMEFATGPLPRISAPPATLPAHPLKLSVADRPEVQAGQTVKAGQLLTHSRHRMGCYVSPIGGLVKTIEVLNQGAEGARFSPADSPDITPDYRFPDPSDWLHLRRGYVMHIEPAGAEADSTIDLKPPQGMKLSNWLALLRECGPWTDRDGGVGLLPQLAAAHEREIDTVILDALDRYPPYPVNSAIMRCFAEEVMAGARIVAELVGAKHVRCTINKAAGISRQVRRRARKHSVHVDSVPNVYPLNDPTVLVHAALRRRIPPRVNPAFHGVIVIEPWTAARLGRWAIRERLDLARPMVIAWPDPQWEPTVTWSFAGSQLETLDARLREVKKARRLIVLGPPMTGRPIAPLDALDDLASATVPDDDLLVTCMGPEALHNPPPEPCIACGWCAVVCPTTLRPAHLFEMCNRPGNMDLVLEQLNWCIDCGLCSHICPSSLPLAQTFRQVTYRYGPLG